MDFLCGRYAIKQDDLRWCENGLPNGAKHDVEGVIEIACGPGSTLLCELARQVGADLGRGQSTSRCYSSAPPKESSGSKSGSPSSSQAFPRSPLVRSLDPAASREVPRPTPREVGRLRTFAWSTRVPQRRRQPARVGPEPSASSQEDHERLRPARGSPR
jgi:hypothetical protein